VKIMLKNKKINYWPILFLLVVLVATVYLVGKKQETRKGAYFSGAKAMIQPEIINADLGVETPVQLWLEADRVTGSEELAKVSSMDVTLCFGSEITLDEKNISNLIELNQEAFKTLVLTSLTKKGANEYCLKLVALSTGIAPDKLKSGLFRAATIKFATVRKGEGRIEVPPERVFIAGYNPTAGSADSSMKVSETKGATYNIGGQQKEEPKNCFFVWKWLGWCR